MRGSVVLLAILFFASSLVAQQPAPPPLVPESFEPAEAVRLAIESEWLRDDERALLRVFHGIWDERDLVTPEARAMVALNAWRLDDPAFREDGVPVELAAEARLLAGDVDACIALLEGATTLRAARLRAEAEEARGDLAAAGRALEPLVRQMRDERIEDAAEMTEGVLGLVIRARLEGQPARDYQSMMTLLAQAHQELDRLYWPAVLAEAELLLDKHNEREGVAALHETLALQPRCARAWYDLGRIALGRFDFASGDTAVAALRRIDKLHPLADLLYGESRLVQNDPDEAIEVLDTVLARLPLQRRALALAAGAAAILYEEGEAERALARFEALSPGSALALYEAGRFLSMNRQYDQAASLLEEAIRRRPQWPAPSIELGLMEMQTARDDKAIAVLRGVAELDPFNKRAANSLYLLEEISGYAERRTEHFVIRYRPGEDEALVDLMPEALEEIHARVTARFGWEPDQPTVIEVMPDHQRFAVRITGMPHIHTIAACTGPIIAFEVPREGAPSLHLGPFDWQRVIQHEYTHTITLGQTRYRIPHWLTEAAAVSMELAPRDYSDCLELARSTQEGTLFDFDEIKWAFVRPKRPGDRGKAYAQGHWMVEFMDERFDPSALVRLLGRYFEGDREEEAMQRALGVGRDEFFADFVEWARGQVRAWGLDVAPSMIELTDALRDQDPGLRVVMKASRQARLDAIVGRLAERIGAPASPGERPFTANDWPELLRPPVEISGAQLALWREAHPDHPDLLELALRRRLEEREPGAEDVADLERYALLRPVDPFPHRKLAQIYLAAGEPLRAAGHLEALDALEEKTPVFSIELAKLYRAASEPERALAKVGRAVVIDPYDARTRELAAAIAVEAGKLDVARLHVRAMTLIEPGRPQHEERLRKLDEIIGRAE